MTAYAHRRRRLNQVVAVIAVLAMLSYLVALALST